MLGSWLLGMALGLIASGAVLAGGVLGLLLLVPTAVWAARERLRPVGLGGLLIGLGVGGAGLLALANARCAGSVVSEPSGVTGCVAPDLTALFVAAAILAAIGVVISFIANRGERSPGA